MTKVNVGVVGCGNICSIYFKRMKEMNILNVAACADLAMERAEAKAQEFGVPRACTVEELMADPEIKIVVNLTIPKAHASVAFKALNAGKSVYNEKPLAISREDGKKLIELAKRKRLLIGGAPDTFLGGGIQTCRKLIEDGWIGKPVAATAFMMCHGHESWHPDPEFYYKTGGGPMFDMGPYYLTALVNLLGPVKSVCGRAKITFPTRTITSQPKNGAVIKVETPTHIAGIMDFASGATGTIITSFDVWGHTMPSIEIYGTLGSIQVPDPNCFGGPVRVKIGREKEWKEVPLTHGYAENSRGLGVADMASSLLRRRSARAGGELTYHVLDIMHAFHDSSKQNKFIQIKSTCRKPALLPLGLLNGDVD